MATKDAPSKPTKVKDTPPAPDPDEPDEPDEPDDDKGGGDQPPTQTPDKVDEVLTKIKDALGTGTKDKGGDASTVTTPEKVDVPAPSTSPPDGGMIEHAVHTVLSKMEHDKDHERLSKLRDTPPRPERKGIARAFFGK